MKKKNNKIASLIKRKRKIIEKSQEMQKELLQIELEEKKWNFGERGPFAYQWMNYLCDSLRKGKRPISLEEVNDACDFKGSEELMKKASIFAKQEAKRQKLQEEFFRMNFMESLSID